MLPDLPKSKSFIRKSFDHFVKTKKKHYSHLPLSDSYRILHEGSGILVNYHDNRNHYSALKNIGSQQSVNIDKLIEDPFMFFDELDKMAKEIADKEAVMFFEEINEVTEMFGNNTKRKGDPTPEDILAMYEKLQIDFNADGTPNLQDIICGKDMFEKLQKVIKEFAESAEYQSRFEEIIKKKKQNWIDRENNRKLVD